MPQSEPVTILIISEHAESIKLITVSLRGFFPGCHVDVAYSTEEARAWMSSDEWTLILIDEQCLSGRPHLPTRQTQTPRTLCRDLFCTATALTQPLQFKRSQVDVDFFLSKQSRRFLTELLFCAKEILRDVT